jgi:ribonuclease D
VDIVRRPPKTPQQLAAIRGLPRPVEQQYGQLILEAVQRVLAQPKSHWPKSQEIEETATERFQIDSLWSAVQTYCMGRGIDPALVATRAEVAEHYRGLLQGNLTDQHPLNSGWRGQFIGQFIAAFLPGQLHLKLRWHEERLDAAKIRDGEA